MSKVSVTPARDSWRDGTTVIYGVMLWPRK
jgi:hypothetical protein